MRCQKILALFLFLILALGTGCSSSDSGTAPAVPAPPMSESLEQYWSTSQDMATDMIALDGMMADLETAIANLDGSKSANEDIDAMVQAYYDATVLAAANFDTLLDLENAIHGYGSDKGMFTDTVGSVVKGVFNATKKAVISSGQMVRTSWRVLSGSHSLRQALSAPDSGIPIVSDYAKRLQEHNARRDVAILQAIGDGDAHDGWVPIGELQGATPAERANYYRNLPDDDPLKKSIRGDVHLWDQGERQAVNVTIHKAGQDFVKTYANTVSGSGELVEVGDQMLSQGQDPAVKGSIAPVIQKVEDHTNVVAPKTMVIQKRNQPEGEPKLVVLDGIDPAFEAELPPGQYDVVVIAENYIRSAELGVEVAANAASDLLLQMYEYAGNSVILESVTATPEVAIVGDVVRADAVAASTLGATLSFDWEVTGGAFTDFTSDGTSCSFVPTEAGDYDVQVTVTGSVGDPKTDSLAVQVSPTDIQVSSFDFTSEEFVDDEANPGETLTLSATVINSTDEPITGEAVLEGTNLITVSGGNNPALTVPAGGAANLTGQIHLPVNYSDNQGTVEFHFTGPDAEIVQPLQFEVAFYVELNAVASPVNDRVLNLSGRVANPSLNSAHLSLDGDLNQVFQVNLVNGIFNQNVALEASNEEVSHHALLAADSGNWHQEDDLAFTSQISPAGFRVTLAWDTNGTDVDLWVTDPSEEKCYYGHTSTASGLHLDFDDVDGFGPENITNATPPAGPYLVQVHYYSDHDDDVAIGTSCTVVIRLNEGTPDEQVFNYYGSLGDTGDIWTVTTLTVGEKGLFRLNERDQYGKFDSRGLPRK